METVSSTEGNDVVMSTDDSSTRIVLAEIPLKSGVLSPTNSQHDINRSDQYANVMHSMYQSTYVMAPFPSPDEMVIQQRGRRNIPIIFSPDLDVIKQNKQDDSSQSSIILKNTPRKRLLYDPYDPSELSSVNSDTNEPNAKKPCTYEHFELSEDDCLLTAMKALTTDQLTGIIEQIVNDHPNIEKDIKSRFPVADLKGLEDRIQYLRRNIYKALPSSRLIPKTDPTAYNKVSIHVMDFKRCVVDEGRRLAESNQWPTVMDYVIMAWKHVRHTPIWDNPSHNAARVQCFKSLSSLCIMALTHMKDTLTAENRETYRKELKLMYNDCKEEVELCLKCLDHE